MNANGAPLILAVPGIQQLFPSFAENRALLLPDHIFLALTPWQRKQRRDKMG